MADPGTDFEAVVAHELELLDPGVRGDPEAVRALLSEQFTEFGASGRAWDRDTITTAIGSEPSEPITAAALRPVRLGADAVLLTYTAHRGGARTLRSSVWVREDDGWRLLHHQGTPCPGRTGDPGELQG
ncbi:DUF4440 domain-containing protein [Actinopolyspora erythraea]|uniref:DUF4440 domain-containing protein n=1 Tax=Actinopolyspora erythraea TaxID=414996 RepID=A0A223RMT6_9ACTN|nr:nuclear transport factor 2 family protein [Actinopolyspora erythraea]ASU77190.1 DUF4440 domain-containing protein [Actinopolyspora erythraea]